MRLTIILRANLAAQANTAIAERTGNPDDARTFVQPLERNGNTVAYWCSWEFAGRNYTAGQVGAKLKQVLGLTDDEVLTRQSVSGSTDLTQIRMVAFNGDNVAPQQVLNYLNLDRPAQE